MKSLFSIIKLSVQVVIIGIILLLAILAFAKTEFANVSPGSGLTAYPPPAPTTNRIGYPAPITITVDPTRVHLLTPTPQVKIEITAINPENKSLRPLTANEQNDYATQIAQKNKNAGQIIPTVTPYRFELGSPSNLAQIILANPFSTGLQESEVYCIKNGKPGSPYFIHSLNDYGDYYILAFYDNNRVCAKAIIRIKNGLGEVTGWSGGRETVYPQISADEAIGQVEKETGKKVLSDPLLIYQDYPDFYADPFNPYWQITTTDKNIYFVSFRRVLSEGGIESTIIQIKNANDLRPAK
jgi:hypothetical protein